MSATGVREILQLCLAIERTAVETYAAFARQAENQEHKVFWQDVSQDEEGHLDYWQRLLVLEGEGGLRTPFDNPDKARAEFVKMLAKVEEMRVGRYSSLSGSKPLCSIPPFSFCSAA